MDRTTGLVVIFLLLSLTPAWANRQWSSGFELNSIPMEIDGGSTGAVTITR